MIILLFIFNLFSISTIFRSHKDCQFTYDEIDCHLSITNIGSLNDFKLYQVPWIKYIHQIKTIYISPNITEFPLNIFSTYENLQIITVSSNMKSNKMPKGFECLGNPSQGYNLNSTISYQKNLQTNKNYKMKMTSPLKFYSKQEKSERFPANVSIYAFYNPSTYHLQTIPPDLLQEYHLDLSGLENPVISQSGSNYVDINKTTGIIKPSKTPTFSTSSGTFSYTTNFGRTFIKITAGKEQYTITLDVIDYESYYSEKVIKDFIAKNITSKQTQLEKLGIITKFTASMNYCYNFSGWSSMVANQCGDCWASTSLILYMCNLVGINGWSRNGNRDSGSGSGHINALISIGDKYYEADAGYSGKGPRYYTIKERTSLFSYKKSGDGIQVYQYDHQNASKSTSLTVPDEIDGFKVVSIGNNFISSYKLLEKLVLPKTIRSIGQHAFNSCYKLKSFHIAVNVSSIGSFAFTACYSLTDLTIDPNNKYFTVIDGVIYDKNLTEAVAAPTAQRIVIPSTVKKIRKYAFYYNDNLTSIVIPKSVTTVLEGALGTTGLVCVYINGDFPTSVSDYMLAQNSKLLYVNINGNAPNKTSSSLKTLFHLMSRKPTIRVPKDAKGYDVIPWTECKIEYVDSVPLSPEQEPLMLIPESFPAHMAKSIVNGTQIQFKSTGIVYNNFKYTADNTNGVDVIVCSYGVLNLTSKEKQKYEYYISSRHATASYYIQEKGSTKDGEFAIFPYDSAFVYLPYNSVPLKLFRNSSYNKDSRVYLQATNESNNVILKSLKLDTGRMSIFGTKNIISVIFDEITFYNKNNLASKNYSNTKISIPIEGKTIVAKGGSRTTISDLVVVNSLSFDYNSTINITNQISFAQGSNIVINLNKKHKIKIVELVKNNTISMPVLSLGLNTTTIKSIDNIHEVSVYGSPDDDDVTVICGNETSFNEQDCSSFALKTNGGYCINTEVNGFKLNCVKVSPTIEQYDNKKPKSALKKTTFIIIGVVVGVVVIIIIVVVVVVIVVKKNKSEKVPKSEDQNQDEIDETDMYHHLNA